MDQRFPAERRRSSIRYRFVDFELDPGEARLTRAGQAVEIQPKVLLALTLLVENAGSLVGKDQLQQSLWPDTFVGEEALTQLMRKLRVALGDDPREPRFVQTVLKRGYRFLPPVAVANGAPAIGRSGLATPVGSGMDTPLAELVQPRGADGPTATERLGASEIAPAPGSVPETPPAATATSEHSLRSTSRRRRRSALWLAGGGLLLLVVMSVWMVRRPPPARTRALVPGQLHRERLTATAERESEPTLAPDGRTYAYVSNGREQGQLDLYLALLAGGNPVRLTTGPEEDFAPEFSPDGSRLAFSREDRETGKSSIWTMSPLGGDERLVVADGEGEQWSPDGREMLFTRRLSDGAIAILRRDLARGEEREVYRSHRYVKSPAWSPDGSTIAFIEERWLRVVPAAGGAVQTIGEEADYIRSVTWDPAGAALITDASWSDSHGNLWRAALDGAPPEPITAGGSGFYEPAVDAAGGRLIFTAENKNRQLWRLDAQGGSPELLSAPSTVECFDVDRAGERLAFTDWDPQPGAGTLGWLDLASGEVRPLGFGLCPAFSPDGRRLAFLGHTPDSLGLWVLDLASGARRRVGDDAGPPSLIERNFDRRPAWSPDGRWIVFESLDRSTGSGLWLAAADGSGERLLAAGSFGPPAFSPDGGLLAAGARQQQRIALFLFPLAGGEPRPLPGPCAFREGPIWEPDGESLRQLADERHAPRLVAVRRDGHGEAAVPISLTTPADPSFWGIFVVRRAGPAGWIYLLERYESDLYLLTPEHR